MRYRLSIPTIGLGLLVTVTFEAGTALGGAVPATANLIYVQATSGGHTATFEQVFPVASFKDSLTWTLPAPLTLSDGAYEVGTINELKVTFNADPQVDLYFVATNGNMTNPVTFNFVSATILFAPIANPEASAAAFMTLTNGAGSAAGASLTGLLPGNKAYEARYSTDGILNTKTLFAGLVDPFSFPSGLTTNASDSLPTDDSMLSLGATCYMMESEFKFSLSGGDQASGTSAFIIVPEPGALGLLALGGLLLRRRHLPS